MPKNALKIQRKRITYAPTYKLLILIGTFLVLSISTPCIGQMSFSKIGETSLFSVSILDSQTYIAVGDFGKIYRTEDGGKNWSQISSSTSYPLYSIKNVGVKTLFISGGNGLILKSTDGGKTWQKLNTGTNKHLFMITFYDVLKGIAVGDWGTIIYTEDGGENWKNVSWKEDRMFYGACFADPKNVWIVGEMGIVLKSVDGGKNWNQRSLPIYSTLTAIDFADRSQGIVVGIDGIIYESRDSGETWQMLRGLPSNHFYDIAYKDNLLICVGDYAMVMEQNSAKWMKWDLPSHFSILWLSGITTERTDQRILTLIVGKKGLFIKNTKRID